MKIGFQQSLFVAAISVAACLALSSCGGEAGSYFNSDTKQMTSDKVGRLEATGDDLRVYEFTPQTMPHKQCVFVAGDKKAAMYCEDKSKL